MIKKDLDQVIHMVLRGNPLVLIDLVGFNRVIISFVSAPNGMEALKGIEDLSEIPINRNQSIKAIVRNMDVLGPDNCPHLVFDLLRIEVPEPHLGTATD